MFVKCSEYMHVFIHCGTVSVYFSILLLIYFVKLIANYQLHYMVHGRVCSPRAPKPLKYNFLGVTQPPGVAQPLYSRGHN